MYCLKQAETRDEEQEELRRTEGQHVDIKRAQVSVPTLHSKGLFCRRRAAIVCWIWLGPVKALWQPNHEASKDGAHRRFGTAWWSLSIAPSQPVSEAEELKIDSVGNGDGLGPGWKSQSRALPSTHVHSGPLMDAALPSQRLQRSSMPCA
jgi:hypothetical protein